MSDSFASAFSSAQVRRGAEWLRGSGPESDVVVSSRVRMARNLRGFPFVRKVTREQREAIMDAARRRLLDPSVMGGAAGGERMLWVDIHACSGMERTLLVERHLISKEHARQGSATGKEGEPAPAVAAGAGGGAGEPRAVAISIPDERLSVMINEEDHLRVQVLRSGMELDAALEQIDAADDRLEGMAEEVGTSRKGGLEYAFSPRFGYLTACPTNVGTAIRVSVMLHLPGLKLAGEMDKVKRATRDLSLAVRGYYGEGSEAAGDFYQISNQTTLGKTERHILEQFEHEIIPKVIEYERAARRALAEKRRGALEDQVLRALGALRYARLLTPEEAQTLLSQVRLGIFTGIITDVPHQTVNQLILLTQPAHLQRVLGKEMDQNSRRAARADLVRQQLTA